jgi:EAL domain-containing protein (putative c-di-GMP-specific phosphodiesterase class I)
MKRKPSVRQRAAMIVVAYAAFSAIWILGSDLLVQWLVHDEKLLTYVQTFKGWVFVFVSSWVFYQQLCWIGQPFSSSRGITRTSTTTELGGETPYAVPHFESSPPPAAWLPASTTKKQATLPIPKEEMLVLLEQAIHQNELQLLYQPIVGLSNGKMVGVEALIRWHQPVLGMVMPADFVPLAEQSDLIIPLGDWILREACQQMKQWSVQFADQMPFLMSVNLSGKQFNHPYLVDSITKILHETQLDAHYLKLEITETAVMQNPVIAIAMLRELHRMGIKLSIDDFGTGYSSLSYLYKFPIDTLKIDRSFVIHIDVDVEQVELVRTVLVLAWNLGLDTIAEGIETPKQMAQLKALGCEYGQGLFFNPPLPPEAIAELFRNEQQPKL